MDRARRRLAQSRLEDVSDLDLDLSYSKGAHGDITNHRVWQGPGRQKVFVGYLVYDHHSENPISSCDGMGVIVRNGGSVKVGHDLGRTSDFEPVLDEFIQYLARLHGEEETDDFSWSEDRIASATALWAEAARLGRVGTAYTFPLRDKYYGGFDECDNADPDLRGIDAVWQPDKCLLDHINSFPEERRQAEGRKAFECALNEYNLWASGESFGIVIDEFTRLACGHYHLTNSDQCWGYVGVDYSQDILDEQMLDARKQALEQLPPPNPPQKSTQLSLPL